jgi:Uma2 family endonuclease
MAMIVKDPIEREQAIARRQACGGDRYDEVWEGVYMMNPMPNNEHQFVASRLDTILDIAIGLANLGEVHGGVNLSDRDQDWRQNYRVPDVAVFLNETAAVDCDTYWRGAADFLVEVVSEHDDTRATIPFYSNLGVRELLIVDRNPWAVELLRFDGKELQSVGVSTAPAGDWLESEAVPLRFRLIAGETRPQIEVEHPADEQRWLV